MWTSLARDSIAQCKQSIVVEGYTDVVMARQHGVDNVVAVLGTALGQRHVRLLRRYADQITLILDGDEAGQAHEVARGLEDPVSAGPAPTEELHHPPVIFIKHGIATLPR